MDVQENPASRGLRRPGRPQRRSSTGAREVRCASSHRNMGTLKIHAMSPVHYVQARPARAPRLGEEGRRRRPSAAASPPPPPGPLEPVPCPEGRSAGPTARSVRRGDGAARATWRPSEPQLLSAPLPPLLQRLLRRGEARLRKRAAQPGRQRGAPGSGLRVEGGPLRVNPDRRGLRTSGSGERGQGVGTGSECKR